MYHYPYMYRKAFLVLFLTIVVLPTGANVTHFKIDNQAYSNFSDQN